jgi:biotin synthase
MVPTVTSWAQLADRSIAGVVPSRDECRGVLEAPANQLLALLDAAFTVRRHHWGRRVSLHVLENAKQGACPEDCGFCSQSSRYGSPGGEAPMRSVDELVAGAVRARAARAKRYCMVTATRGPSSRDLDVICEAARRIKAEVGELELCASLGLLTESKARRLVESGVDRFNHNLETSERHWDQVVTTHAWRDRVETVAIARRAGMETCCGGIVGLGEDAEDLIDLALALRELDVDSVPVNFLDPRPGTPMAAYPRITAEAALRALCLFRFVHPRTDLRVAGGREVTLRSLQVLALYPANSIFTQGYLTTGGATARADHEMIRDAGFELELVGGQTAPADPDALGAAPARRGSLPQAS